MRLPYWIATQNLLFESVVGRLTCVAMRDCQNLLFETKHGYCTRPYRFLRIVKVDKTHVLDFDDETATTTSESKAARPYTLQPEAMLVCFHVFHEHSVHWSVLLLVHDC